MKRLHIALAALALGLAANAAALELKKQGAVEWVCGGVGLEERLELKALEARANGALLFVTERRGGYLADVEFRLLDASGAAVLEGRADGPMCLLKVQPGRYRVEASFEGAKRSGTLDATKGTGKPPRAVLSFPLDKSERIPASPEEKAAARAP